VINEQVDLDDEPRTRWALKKADWIKFETECKTRLTVSALDYDVNTSNRQVTAAIIGAADVSIPNLR